MVDMGCMRRMSMNDNCVETLANHDVEIEPHTIEL